MKWHPIICAGLLCLGLCTLSPAFGQRISEIKGKVLDAQAGTPVIGARVFDERNPNYSTITNEKGEFRLVLSDPLRRIRTDRAKIRITAVDYQDNTKTIQGDAKVDRFYTIQITPIKPRVIINGYITYPDKDNPKHNQSSSRFIFESARTKATARPIHRPMVDLNLFCHPISGHVFQKSPW